jgi:hypothetical protein
LIEAEVDPDVARTAVLTMNLTDIIQWKIIVANSPNRLDLIFLSQRLDDCLRVVEVEAWGELDAPNFEYPAKFFISQFPTITPPPEFAA